MDFSYLLRDLPIEKQLLVMKEALYKSTAGRQNLIETIEEDGQLKFRVNFYRRTENSSGQEVLTRKVFQGLREASEEVSSYKISEFFNLDPQAGVVSNQYRDVSAILEAINEGVTDPSKRISAQIAIYKSENKSDASVAQFIKDMQSLQRDQGMVVMTDDSALVVNYIQGDKILSTNESIDMLVKNNKQILNAEEVNRALLSSDPQKELNSLFSKAAKRYKGIYSPRDVSLAGEALAEFLGVDPSMARQPLMDALGSKMLVTSEMFEMLAEYSGINTIDKLGKNITEQTQDSIVLARHKIGQMQGGIGSIDSYLTELENTGKTINRVNIKTRIQELIAHTIDSGKYNPSGGLFGIDEVKTKLKQMGDNDDYKIIKGMIDEISKGFDGSGLMNMENQRGYKKSLGQKIAALMQQPNLTSEQKKEIVALQQEYDQISQNISQGTIRGSIRFGQDSPTYMPKGALASEELGKVSAQINGSVYEVDLKKYMALFSETMMKKEVGSAKDVPIFNLSGLTESKSTVYADPMLISFHDATFASEQDFKMMQKMRQKVEAEMAAIIHNGRLSDDHEIIRMARMMANGTGEMVLPEQQFSKLLNANWQNAILEAHMSGASITSYGYMNAISDYYRTQMYTFRKGMYLPTMSEIYRFAINSEANAVSGVSSAAKLLNQSAQSIDIGGQSVDVAQFRLRNHQLLLHHDDVRRFYHVLGGFDLDDKALPIVGTYMSNGQRRLGFSLVRQPTGQEEIGKLLSLVDDQESYREMFKGNKYFMQTLEGMAEAGDADAQTLFNIMQSNSSVQNFTKMEETTIRVLDEVYGGNLRVFDNNYFNAQKLSASQLISMAGENPDFGQMGVRKLQAESKRLEIAKAVREVIDEDASLFDAQTAQMLRATNDDEILGRLGQLVNQNNETIQNIINRAYSKVDLNRALSIVDGNQSSLGLYINRATIAGHWLNQVEKLGSLTNDEMSYINQFGKGQISLLPTETPVDLTQTMTTGQLKAQMSVLEIAGQQGTEEDAIRILRSAFPSIGKDAISAGGGTAEITASLNQINPVRMMSRQLGYFRAGGKSGVIDVMFSTSGKLTGDDLKEVIQGMTEGFVAKRQHYMSSGMQQQADELSSSIATMQGFVQRGDVDEIQEYLKTSGIFAGAENPLATISRFSAEGQQRKMLADSLISVANQSFLAERQKLLAASDFVSQATAKSVVDELVENHADILREITQELSKPAQDRLAMHGVNMDIARAFIGNDVLNKINEAVEQGDANAYKLINAFEYEFQTNATLRNAGLKFEQLRDFSFFADNERANMLNRYTTAARTRRAYEEATRVAGLRDIAESAKNLFEADLGISARALLDPITFNEIIDSTVADDVRLILEANNISDDMITDVLRGIKGNSDQMGQGARLIYSALQQSANLTIAEQNDAAAFDFINAVTQRPTSTASIAGELTDEALTSVSGFGNRQGVNASRYKRLSFDYIAEKLSNKNIRNAAIAGGVLIAASFMYQKNKGVSVDDVGGPPLLPGGSAYEDQYPTRIPQMPTIGGLGAQGGMSYRINVNGGQGDIDKLRSALAGVTNSSINLSMYQSSPSVQRDPYSQIGSSY